MNESLFQSFSDNIEAALETKSLNTLKDVRDLAPEIRYDVPDCNVALVSGIPDSVAATLDYKQGDNPYNTEGNCGLVSISNLCRIAGLNVTENDVTRFALTNRLCNNGWFMSSADRGGVGDPQIISILAHYGMDATAFSATEIGGKYDAIADAIESGHGVTMGINAGYFWNEPRYACDPYGAVSANHQIVVTRAVRDCSNGEVIGFYTCDSGRGLPSDAKRYVPVSLLDKAYSSVQGASVVITNNPIRR